MTPTERAYILATPLQEPGSACWIAFQAKAGSSNHFANYAKQNSRLFERKRNYADTMFFYRLTNEGAALRWELERPASADTHPKDGDVKQAPLVSGAVGEAETPNPRSQMSRP